jgi:hypothetical protein
MAQEGELRVLLSNRWRTQEHKDNSPQGDRNSTRSAEGIGVVGEREEPGQLREECRGLDRDKPVQDTSTIHRPRSTTSRADSRATHETSVLRARRRYRVHENGRCVHAMRAHAIPASPG